MQSKSSSIIQSSIKSSKQQISLKKKGTLPKKVNLKNKVISNGIDWNTKLRFFGIMLSYGIYSPLYLSMAIIFYRPEIECQKYSGAPYEVCSEEEMCNQNLPFRFSSQFEQIYSYSMEKNLYCDRKIFEVILLSLGPVARFVGFILNWYFVSKPHLYYSVILWTQIAVGSIMTMMQIFDNIYYFIFTIIVWNLGLTVILTHTFAYARNFAPTQIRDRSVALIAYGWTILAAVYSFFVTKFGYWKQTIVLFIGLGCLTNAIHLYAVREKTEQKPEIIHQVETNTFQEFKNCLSEIFASRKLLKNTFIWIVIYCTYSVTIIAFYTSLNSLGGNLYFIMFCATAVETTGSSVVQYLLGKINLARSIYIAMKFVGLSFLCGSVVQGLRNNRIEGSEWGEMLLWLLPLFAASLVNITIFPFSLEILKELFDTPAQQTFVNSIGNVISLLLLVFLPYYKYLMVDILNINQFLGYGIFVFLNSYLAKMIVQKPQVYSQESNELQMSLLNDKSSNIQLQQDSKKSVSITCQPG